MHDMATIDCDHKNQNMKWEADVIVHTCRICHETWTTVWRAYGSPSE